jgi:hypothetical protein
VQSLNRQRRSDVSRGLRPAYARRPIPHWRGAPPFSAVNFFSYFTTRTNLLGAVAPIGTRSAGELAREQDATRQSAYGLTMRERSAFAPPASGC